MTYSLVMLSMWAVALGVTLLGLLAALRALFRADEAVARLRAATVEVEALGPASAAVVAATHEAAASRAHLHGRAGTDRL